MRLIGFAGWSGAGKTTLLARLLPVLIRQGCRVSTIKHAHHGFDIDRPGKDSHTHRRAGATEVLISSAQRWALMHERREEPQPRLQDLLRRLSPVDFVLIEGFKTGDHPKIEVFRPAIGKALLQPDDPHIIGVVTDEPLQVPVPTLPFDDIEAIAAFVKQRAVPWQTAEPQG